MGLFLREPSGAMHLVAENHGSEPRFAGHYLFFDSSGPLGSTQALSQVRGVDLRTLHQFVVVSGRSEHGGEWGGGFGAPLARHTLVVHNDRCDCGSAAQPARHQHQGVPGRLGPRGLRGAAGERRSGRRASQARGSQGLVAFARHPVIGSTHRRSGSAGRRPLFGKEIPG